MKQHLRSYSAFVLVLFLSFAAAGQKTEVKKKKTNLENKYPQSGIVQVKGNLLVLDAENKYVEEIAPDRVKIFEDGVEQKITYFALKAPPMHVGLVVDNSGSVRHHIEGIAKAAKIVITNLRDGDGSFVIRFVNSDNVELVQDHTTNRANLIEAIENLFIEGGQSAIFDGLFLAANRVVEWETKAPKNRFAIILITDGEDLNSYYDLDQLLKLFEKSDLQIFPLFFTGELTDKFSSSTRQKFGKSNAIRLARVLALKTGGLASFVEGKISDDVLLNALKPIMIELRSQFIFGYTPTNQKRDGLPRKLTVEIMDSPSGAKHKGYVRDSFVVPID